MKKFTLRKEAIYLSEVEDAKAMAEERAWMLDKTVLLDAASVVLSRYHGTGICAGELVSIGEASICKNHYELRPWVSVTVKYWDGDDYAFSIIGMDLVETYEKRNGEAFLQVFPCKFSDCIR